MRSIAYDVTGSLSDAEDVAQQAYERWLTARDVHDPRAWLARCATNLAIDRLRARRKVDYVGPWLPEPILTAPDASADSLVADDVSVALLVVLETLGPLERAAFLLHDVFDFSTQEVAGILERSPVAVRQLLSRARRHVTEGRPRRLVDDRVHRELVSRFLAAAAEGDLGGLTCLLSEDVVLVSDGGGVVSAATRPVRGRGAVLRFMIGLATKFAGRFSIIPAELNGDAGWLLILDGELDYALSCAVDDGRITRFYLQRNPGKLGHIRRSLDRDGEAASS